jgi:hypothetical protein
LYGIPPRQHLSHHTHRPAARRGSRHVDTRSTFGQSPAVHLTQAGRPALPWRRDALILSFGRRDTLLQILQAEC